MVQYTEMAEDCMHEYFRHKRSYEIKTEKCVRHFILLDIDQHDLMKCMKKNVCTLSNNEKQLPTNGNLLALVIKVVRNAAENIFDINLVVRFYW